MTMGTWVLLFVLIAVAGIAALVIWRQRVRYEKARERMQNEYTASLESKESEAWQLNVQSHRDRAREEATHQEELKRRVEKYQEDLERLREWSARGLRWEETSRKRLVEDLTSLNVNGFVATNVCFMAQHDGRPFMHQIDHVVVAEDMLFIVEAKYWKGRIFHRYRSNDQTNSFIIDALPMLDHVKQGQRYVVRVNADGEDMLWFPRNGIPEPVKQVQMQSVRFRDHLKVKTGAEPHEVYNCVLYCHPDSELVGGTRQLTNYTWVTDAASLVRTLDAMRNCRNDNLENQQLVDVKHMYDIVESLGADIVGIGTYAQHWRSPLPLGYQRVMTEEANET